MVGGLNFGCGCVDLFPFTVEVGWRIAFKLGRVLWSCTLLGCLF